MIIILIVKKSQEFLVFVGRRKWTSRIAGHRNVSIKLKYNGLCL